MLLTDYRLFGAVTTTSTAGLGGWQGAIGTFKAEQEEAACLRMPARYSDARTTLALAAKQECVVAARFVRDGALRHDSRLGEELPWRELLPLFPSRIRLSDLLAEEWARGSSELPPVQASDPAQASAQWCELGKRFVTFVFILLINVAVRLGCSRGLR